MASIVKKNHTEKKKKDLLKKKPAYRHLIKIQKKFYENAGYSF